MADALTARLNNGASIPLLGFGTAGGPSYSSYQIKDAVFDAIEVGYRHIDTASIYGSEPAIGEALDDAFKAGKLDRKDMFITSKLWCTEVDDVVAAIKRSLSALKLDYLDLYLIHWPLKFKKQDPFLEDVELLDIQQTWKGMEECVELGLAKAIGVSNFSSKKITDMLEFANIPPAVNQVEMHPNWQQKKLREICKRANVHVSAWSPLGSPNIKWGTYAVIEHPAIRAIAERRGKTPAQVALRWGLEQGVSVLPKSYNKSRVAENFDIFDWSLTEEDRERISKFEQKRCGIGMFLADGSLYNDPGLWDGED